MKRNTNNITPAEIDTFKSDFTTVLHEEAKSNPYMTKEKIDFFHRKIYFRFLLVVESGDHRLMYRPLKIVGDITTRC